MRVYGCITHIPLPQPFPDFVTPICLGQAQAPGRLNLRDLAPDWEPHHPVLGGSAGTFALKNLLLRDHPQATSVGICQYRKFVSRRRASRVVAANYKAMDIVNPAAATVDRLADWLDPGDEPFLVSRLLKLHSGYLGQYADAHLAQDFLRFLAQAVELGALESSDLRWFVSETWFIPGGIELGVFPTEFWIPAVTAIEAVVRACIEQHPVTRPDYQLRVWAFCAERLGSWLLLRRFRQHPWPPRAERLRSRLPGHWRQRYVGHLNIIAERADAGYVPGRS